MSMGRMRPEAGIPYSPGAFDFLPYRLQRDTSASGSARKWKDREEAGAFRMIVVIPLIFQAQKTMRFFCA